jgi:hypothetical protein
VHERSKRKEKKDSVFTKKNNTHEWLESLPIMNRVIQNTAA